MNRTFKLLVATFALALTGCASAPQGQDTAITLGGGPAAGQEAADHKVVEAAMSAMQATGYRGLKPHLGKLKEALNHAPASYPAIERQPNGDYIVRADDMADGITLSVMAVAVATEAKDKGNVTQGPNVYPMIAMMLGSDAVERRAFAEAHIWLDRGLALQPNHWSLLAEKASAYVGQGKWDDALKLADTALASDDLLLSMHRDAFLRKRGYALVELGRLDEAQAAYEEALKVNKDDATSQNELEYIKGLRQGNTPSLGVQQSPVSNQ